MDSTVRKATALASPDAIVADRVSKAYQLGGASVQALAAASLTVANGEFVSVMGPSGSGKSTLLGLIAGLDVPSSGSIHVRGRCVSSMSDDEATVFRRQHVGFVFQRFSLLPDLTIEENVGAALMLDGRGDAEIQACVEEALRQVALWERRRHLPAEVSGGELQRAAIARALVAEPAVILADEPTGNLDSATGERVLLDMRRTVDEYGRTILLVTHDPIAAAYADRTVHLRDGTFQRSSGR